MLRTLIITSILLTSTSSISQTISFSEAVRTLFFQVDVRSPSISLVDSFKQVKQLHYLKHIVCQTNLNVSMQMGGDIKAKACRHKFTFDTGPLQDIKIGSGYIELNIGEAKSFKKLLDVEWRLEFNNESDATTYFEKLKSMFEPVSTNKKMEYDEEVGYIAQFSTRDESMNAIRDISIILAKPLQGEKHEILLMLNSEFEHE